MEDDEKRRRGDGRPLQKRKCKRYKRANNGVKNEDVKCEEIWSVFRRNILIKAVSSQSAVLCLDNYKIRTQLLSTDADLPAEKCSH